jgi:endonuclease/exonuclease/phosphatase (EEP) superfamily protein YafD
MRAMRGGLSFLTLLTLVLLGLGFCGGWMPLGDTLAVGRLHLAALLVLAAAFLFKLRARRLALIALVTAVLASGQIVAGFYPPDAAASGRYTLYQKNLLGRAWPRYPLADEIVASNADFVTLQEVSDHNLRFMDKLFQAYPSKKHCDFRKVGGVTVMSRFPVVPGSAQCGDLDGLALMQVLLPHGEAVWIASLHLHWPFPYEQAEQVERVVARLKLLRGPVILAGDFNMVPWGSSVARVARAARAHRLGPYRPSYPIFGPLLFLPIDHVMLPDGASGNTEIRPAHGSDHLGILARFDL